MLYFIGIGTVVALMGFATVKHSQKNINGLDISVLDYDSVKFINDELVRRLVESKFDSLNFKKCSQIDVAKIEKEVRKLSSVKKADAYIDIDGKLSIKIVQRKPVARVYTDKFNCYIDDNGKMMPLSLLYSADVPLIMGKVKKENLEEVYTLLTFIRKNVVLNEQIVSISIDKNNEYTFRTRKGNQVIEFGRVEDVEEKFNKLLIYYRKTVSDFGWERYKKINLEFANQVVCTKR